ncbi:restriction endonuclease subunit S [Arenimonas terrae]|uniref:Restriction endonuclease subunit S n=1 Tax=Arenimonas terrae TaxID=2546226 RepID=A0A5C4RRM2_9GAMM|nr:restriction endonuclease subunit S [Arenimonas terrae]TNJ33732.1 restriction endonuclease subunit S [Arenimonas terrae]
MSFSLSKDINPSSVFIERKANVIGRFDPLYFRPDLVALEKKVRSVAKHQLRDFVRSMVGGATPSTKEAETHYTGRHDGIPFIRVQNLSTTGRLNLEDCKFITRSTHEGLLRRSRLKGGELLVKITGVGRMAVASVVPDDFDGNINQHMVAIRTENTASSEALASYLNLDIAERLASRRSTGGTRPALDYPALLSIPVVLDVRIPELMRRAVDSYKLKLAEASRLLETIDDLLLDDLTIRREPERQHTIENRIFFRNLTELSGGRFDPIAAQEKRRTLEGSIRSAHYPVAPLRQVVSFSKVLVDRIDEGDTYVGLENINGETGEYVATTEKESVGTAIRFKSGQILFPKLRPYLNKTHLAAFSGVASTEFHTFTAQRADAKYLTAFLRSKVIVGITTLLMTGNTLPRLQTSDIEQLPIPIPPVVVQKRICEQIDRIRAKAFALRDRANTELRQAKRDIEALIIGKGVSA